MEEEEEYLNFEYVEDTFAEDPFKDDEEELHSDAEASATSEEPEPASYEPEIKRPKLETKVMARNDTLRSNNLSKITQNAEKNGTTIKVAKTPEVVFQKSLANECFTSKEDHQYSSTKSPLPEKRNVSLNKVPGFAKRVVKIGNTLIKPVDPQILKFKPKPIVSKPGQAVKVVPGLIQKNAGTFPKFTTTKNKLFPIPIPKQNAVTKVPVPPKPTVKMSSAPVKYPGTAIKILTPKPKAVKKPETIIISSNIPPSPEPETKKSAATIKASVPSLKVTAKIPDEATVKAPAVPTVKVELPRKTPATNIEIMLTQILSKLEVVDRIEYDVAEIKQILYKQPACNASKCALSEKSNGISIRLPLQAQVELQELERNVNYEEGYAEALKNKFMQDEMACDLYRFFRSNLDKIFLNAAKYSWKGNTSHSGAISTINLCAKDLKIIDILLDAAQELFPNVEYYIIVRTIKNSLQNFNDSRKQQQRRLMKKHEELIKSMETGIGIEKDEDLSDQNSNQHSE